MTTGIGPYVTPDPVDTAGAGTVLETVLVASLQTVDVGGGVMANAETYNGTIPGPTLRLNVGDTVIVRLINDLPHPTGIHWHGIELGNSADGTPVTQHPVAAGGTHLYKFKVPRPGIYWYHPHHHHSTNRVFRGLYGMIVVTDPHEAALISAGTLPGPADTVSLVLSDVTVCKSPGSNDAQTYASTLPWVGGASLPTQPAPTPVTLCEIAPTGQAMNEDGSLAAASFAAGDVPNIQRAGPGRTNEGQTVLTNGVDVGGRAGSPAAPGSLAAGAATYTVAAGQGLRLQIVNCATTRYFRLLLTTSTGIQVPLVRIGGEGGLLDDAVVEGGVVGGFDTKYTSGEILLPPASRADVVAAIPAAASGVLTLWTQDYQQTGFGYSNIPTVPVMHLDVSGSVTPFTIAAGTPLRASIAGAAVETLPAPDGTLLDPSGFSPPKAGMSIQDIQLTATGAGVGINSVPGSFGSPPYPAAPHIGSSRYAQVGRVLELTVTNTSQAHHPFHLHGFSFQPISLTKTGDPTYTWPYREFRDNLDIPAGYTLTFRVRLEDRPLDDGATPGGALGRWLFHCHIFFHAHQGMISELTVTATDGSEKPHVDVRGSWAYAPIPGIATRTGTFSHPDSDAVTLTTSLGTVMVTGSDTWAWSLDTTGMSPGIQYVYVTATDASGRRDQTVFRLKIGAPDDGADNGDPHIHTVDGKRYDFQAVGEFVLLRDREGMEIQTRQTPVRSANPIADPYSGLTSCVSVNTAVAARVGDHTISYQPGRQRGAVELFVDGKRAELPGDAGLDLGAHRLSSQPVSGGGSALRIAYAHHPVVTITPYLWTSHDVWLLNVSVVDTHANEGLMGPIPAGSWLPRLASGAAAGPMPPSLHDRYVTLYRAFADSWRVSNASSLFVYAPGTSTETFTDTDWPAEKPPCRMKPGLEVPGAPDPVDIGIDRARAICQMVTHEDLNRDCVFDVATTGDGDFARGYELAQELRLRGTKVHLGGDPPRTREGEPLTVTAIVTPLAAGRPTPRGEVTFFVDDASVGPPVPLDPAGRAGLTLERLAAGEHRIRASYRPSGDVDASGSANLVHTVSESDSPVAGGGIKGKPWLWMILLTLLLAVVLFLLWP